ncbi:polysaccharide deacetylase family protein [Haloterrigena salifodinae]|uniref:polysaccharide deacetylase family protein n=1 Tax=Haloterrigena salifodinae TaxID=2675099 RepID=UPI000F899440|nr:polysaccharide deacetylase family protein [Haloterrigena salifodinae]
MNRRTYLAAAASTAGLGLAGCADLPALDEDAENGDDSSPPASDPAADLPDVAGTVDDFEDLEAWAVAGGTLTADPDRAAIGSQSARLTVGETEQMARLTRTFADPRDLTDVVPGVAVAADELVVPWLRLVDDEGAAIEYRRGIVGDLPLERYNFGVSETDPAFDAASVRKVSLRLWTTEGDRRTVWFDDLHFTPRPKTGQVMIQFDDAHVTDYTEALPRLESYDYPATTFVNSGYIGGGDVGGDSRLTVDQLRELRDAGWCVANHAKNHPKLPELDADEQETQIRAGKEWLVERGFEDGADYFAYPFGQYDATSIELVDEYHSIGFGGGPPAQGYTTNTKLASRIGNPSADRVRTALEHTVERRGITGLFFHRLEGDHLEAFETMIEMIREYESKGKLEVILPRDLEERFLF